MPDALEIIKNDEHGRYQRYAMYRQYYDGRHETQLTDRQRKYLELKPGQEFNDNYIPVVVDALAERIAVAGIAAGEQTAELWQWWLDNRADALQGVVHGATVRDGDDFLLVEWSEFGPVWSFEPSYDGNSGAGIVYSSEHRNEPLFGWKRWRADSENERINVYWPERVDKYTGSGHDFTLTETVKWVDSAGVPLGIPLIHFKNRDQGYKYGRSEVADVIPLQNALNKSIIDLIAAADTTAFRLYWGIGDKFDSMDVSPGGFIYSEKPKTETEFGHFPGEDLSNMIAIKDSFVAEVARVTRTPLSYFQMGGQIAAEGTLKQQESGLVSRAKDRQVTFGNAWEDVFYLSRRLHNAFSTEPEIDESQTVQILWADPETRNDAAFIEMLKTKHELNVPIDTLWAEMGYSEERIEEFKESNENKLFTMTEAALMWKAIADASGGFIPVETILRSIGFDDEQMKEFGTQKLAAITLEQEDVIPESGL